MIASKYPRVEPTWLTEGAKTEWVDGIPFPDFPRPNGPLPTDGCCEVLSSSHGHFNCIWDPNSASEVADAKNAFDRAKADGRRPFHVDKNGATTGPMEEFDPNAGKMIILPRIAGG